MSRAKNPKYESMSLEELKANMEKSRQELEAAIHHKNILEQRKKLVERRERSHRLIVKGAEFEKVFPLSRDLEQEDVQDMMNQLQNSSYNKSIVRQAHIAALHKDQQQIAEAVKKTEGRWWLLPQPIFPGRGFLTVITTRYTIIRASQV